MTIHEKIWQACHGLGKEQFTFEDIVMACYTQYHESFKMKQYDHPDTRRMAGYLSGPRSALEKGVLMKASKTTYRIGARPNCEEAMKKTRKDKTIFTWLNRLLNTWAAKKITSVEKGELTLLDAMEVLQIKQIGGLGRVALKEAKEKLRQIEMKSIASITNINTARAILNKVTALVDRYDHEPQVDK